LMASCRPFEMWSGRGRPDHLQFPHSGRSIRRFLTHRGSMSARWPFEDSFMDELIGLERPAFRRCAFNFPPPMSTSTAEPTSSTRRMFSAGCEFCQHASMRWRGLGPSAGGRPARRSIASGCRSTTRWRGSRALPSLSRARGADQQGASGFEPHRGRCHSIPSSGCRADEPAARHVSATYAPAARLTADWSRHNGPAGLFGRTQHPMRRLHHRALPQSGLDCTPSSSN